MKSATSCVDIQRCKQHTWCKSEHLLYWLWQLQYQHQAILYTYCAVGNNSSTGIAPLVMFLSDYNEQSINQINIVKIFYSVAQQTFKDGLLEWLRVQKVLGKPTVLYLQYMYSPSDWVLYCTVTTIWKLCASPDTTIQRSLFPTKIWHPPMHTQKKKKKENCDLILNVQGYISFAQRSQYRILGV